ncbi:hypothetical protein [Mesorhizobium sp.]|uniref:hypothetical protein n=1 Tax=Mesorhizobium sp. TaxID=1871066 RepID=UPI00344E45E6
MNFLRATVSGGKALLAGEASVDISHLATRLKAGRSVTLGIRRKQLDEKRGLSRSPLPSTSPSAWDRALTSMTRWRAARRWSPSAARTSHASAKP